MIARDRTPTSSLPSLSQGTSRYRLANRLELISTFDSANRRNTQRHARRSAISFQRTFYEFLCQKFCLSTIKTKGSGMSFNYGRKWNDAETRGYDFYGNQVKFSVVPCERNHENGCGRRGDATGKYAFVLRFSVGFWPVSLFPQKVIKSIKPHCRYVPVPRPGSLSRAGFVK